MIPSRLILPALAVAAWFAAVSPVQSAVTPFTDATAWTAAAGAPLVAEDFADPALAPNFSITFGSSGGIGNGVYVDTALTQFNDAGNPKLNFAGEGALAFGATFDLTPGGRGDGLILVVLFVNGLSQQLVLANPAGAAYNGFFGFVSDSPVRTVRLDSPGTGTEAFAMDNARFRIQQTSSGKIRFDDVADGTVINTRYPGVSFINPIGGNIFARASAGAPSAPNIVSVFGTGVPAFDARFGAVDATFDTPMSMAAIDVRPLAPPEFAGSLTKRPFLQAFDASGSLLTTIYYAGALPTTGGGIGPVETLTYTSPTPNIKRVRFSVQNPNQAPTAPPTYGLFDNFCFDSIFSLTANTSGGGSVSASPSAAGYTPGTVVTLRATAQPGFWFSGWSGDASGTANPLQVTMDRAKSIQANFIRIPSTPQPALCADFNSGSPAGFSLFGDAQVRDGRLKLYTVGQTNGFGIVYLDDFNGGAPVTSFRATFKAALFGATCCGGGFFPADGFSFNLVPAATVRANPGYSEPGEEGLPEGLSINFDTWDNGFGEAPAIEVKWLGQIVAAVPFQASQSPVGINDVTAALRDVVINLDADGTVDVSYGGTTVLSNVQTPYRASVIGAPKWVFGARVGLATDNHWIDDLCINANSGSANCLGFDQGIPSGVRLFGDARVEGGRLKLNTVGGPAQTNGFGIAYVDDFSGGYFVRGFRATFKAALFGSTCCGAFPADGFSFNLVPAASVRANPGYDQPGEEGLPEGLAVNFDSWDNGAGEGPAIEVKWLSNVVARVAFQPSQSPAGITDPVAATREVVISLDVDGTIDVSYGGTPILVNVQTPYDPVVIGRPIWVLGSRIGGANDNHWIDDLCIATVPSSARVPRIYNTGVNDYGLPLADNAVDSHYTATPAGSVVYAATAAGGFPIPPWIADNGKSAWISIAQDTLALGDTTGFYNYRYETTLDLSGLDPARVQLVGRWATDNGGVDILINGTSTGQNNSTQFADWTPFRINSGFVPGLNRVAFVVNNSGSLMRPEPNPTGLRVEYCGLSSSPARLDVRRQGNQAVVTWLGSGYVLQSAPTVLGPWSDLAPGFTSNGTDYSVTLPASGPERYLRLRLECE